MPKNRRIFNFFIVLKLFYHKYGLGHIILLFCYLLFLLIFATTFYYVENKQSNTYFHQWQNQISNNRQKFIKNELIPDIFNNTKLFVFIHDHKAQYLMKLLQDKLMTYEKKLKIKPPLPILQCTFTNSILYAFSSVTTIGYSYIHPITRTGRLISIGFSIFGIPFTIIVIKDLEYLLVKLLSYPCIFFVQIWHMFRFCTLWGVSETETEEKLDKSQLKHKKDDYRISTAERLLLMPIMIVVSALIGWISMGCILGSLYNPNVETHNIVYFIFNTLSTTGIGGIDLQNNSTALAVLITYSLCGLAIVSVFINLIHTKFSKQYWLPGNSYMPLLQRNQLQHANLAKIETFDENLQDYAIEPPIYRYTTMGIFQAEDRCPLINEINRNYASNIAFSQEQPTQTVYFQQMASPIQNVPRLPQINDSQSHDDVNSLLVETYPGRAPRIIQL